MRLIDADLLRIRVAEEATLIYDIDEIIRNAPTIDPVKRGEWTMDTDPDDGDCRCSCCRACIDALHKRNHDIIKALGFKLNTFYRYCPTCGARMEGE